MTPNVAAVLAAGALLLAVIGAFVLAFRFHADITTGVNRVAAQDQQVSYVDGARRIVRSTSQPGTLVVCSEGFRQLQRVTGSTGDNAQTRSTPAAELSTIYLREAGWQICNAYANGAIDAAQYADLLKRAVSQGATVARSSTRTGGGARRRAQRRGARRAG